MFVIPEFLKGTIRNLYSLQRRDSEYQERWAFFQKAFRALSFNGIDGDYAEFGCWTGKTFHMAYSESRRFEKNCHLWAFDSFCGLPPQLLPEDEHPVWISGHMKTSIDEFRAICKRNKIPETDYSIVPGFYADTIGSQHASSVDHFPQNICLAYIDCDLYTSTRTVLEFLYSRMKHGMILAFDDYYNWSATAIAGERRAFIDLLGGQDRFHFLPYVQFGWHGMSFVVEDSALILRRAETTMVDPVANRSSAALRPAVLAKAEAYHPVAAVTNL